MSIQIFICPLQWEPMSNRIVLILAAAAWMLGMAISQTASGSIKSWVAIILCSVAVAGGGWVLLGVVRDMWR
jgi:hypothetical protein